MLELLEAQDGVIAMRATGLLDAADIERGIAAVDEALNTHARLSIYAEVDIAGMTPRRPLKDIAYGISKLGELRRFWRAAVVTDQHWIQLDRQSRECDVPGRNPGVPACGEGSSDVRGFRASFLSGSVHVSLFAVLTHPNKLGRA